MICALLAPYTRLTSTSSRGTDCTAAMPPRTSTKIVVKTAKAIFCGMLTPKTRMKTGRKMDLGTPNRKFTRGRTSAPSTGASARMKPRRRPVGNAITKAARTSQPVTARLSRTSGRPSRRTSDSTMVVGAGARVASIRPMRDSISQSASRPRMAAATIRRSCRRMALRLGRGDRNVHEDLGRRRHVLHPARRRQLHGLLHGRQRHLAVAREAQKGLLVLHLGDLHRQLVVGGDGLDRIVGIVAHVLECAVERIQAFQDEGAALVQVLVRGRPPSDQVRRHGGGEVLEYADLALGDDLVAERRVDDGGGQIVVEEIGREPSPAHAHALEGYLGLALRPQGQRVGARAGRGDPDLLAVQLLDGLDGRSRLDAQDPARPLVTVAAHDLDEYAALARRRYQGNRHRPQIRRVRGDRLEGLAAAPVDRDLRARPSYSKSPFSFAT